MPKTEFNQTLLEPMKGGGKKTNKLNTSKKSDTKKPNTSKKSDTTAKKSK